MSKRKAQFDIAGDLEKEDCLPQIGVINTQEEIQQRRILKIKGPKEKTSTGATKLLITAPVPTFTTFEESKPSDKPQTPPKLSKIFSNSQPLNYLPIPAQQVPGLLSPTIVFTQSKHQQDDYPKPPKLSPIDEKEEYTLFKNNLEWAKIDEKEYNQNVKLEIIKTGDKHILNIDNFKGRIFNNKYNKSDFIVTLECQQNEDKNDKLHQISFKFIDEKDYELFII